ncbi:MAG: alpha/beta hydrolase [Acidobacteriota bacterium]|nr:alpha/beta hydrolase [Acidobacteriota bacterium]
MTTARLGLLLAASAMSASCGLLYRGGVRLFYKEVKLPAAQIVRDIPYAGLSSTPKQQLNLFVPQGKDWPMVVFVHGGSWFEGDKNLEVGGADVYNNIGRFLASNGIGAAVISYRLLPEVSWQGQAADAATAVQWVGAHAREYGARPGCVFLMGHSAGAQIAARVALEAAAGRANDGAMPATCGVIAVSGAGYDMADQRTYELGNNPGFYERRFGGTPDWQTTASPIRFVTREAAPKIPPFLLLYAGGETKPLQRQSQLLHERLLAAGARSSIVVVPGESHTRIVLTLSRDDKTAGPAILTFIRSLQPANIAHSASATMAGTARAPFQ